MWAGDGIKSNYIARAREHSCVERDADGVESDYLLTGWILTFSLLHLFTILRIQASTSRAADRSRRLSRAETSTRRTFAAALEHQGAAASAATTGLRALNRFGYTRVPARLLEFDRLELAFVMALCRVNAAAAVVARARGGAARPGERDQQRNQHEQQQELLP
jgi:hypothetical protein